LARLGATRFHGQQLKQTQSKSKDVDLKIVLLP